MYVCMYVCKDIKNILSFWFQPVWFQYGGCGGDSPHGADVRRGTSSEAWVVSLVVSGVGSTGCSAGVEDRWSGDRTHLLAKLQWNL